MAHHFEFDLSRDDVLLFELAACNVSTWLLTDGSVPLLTLAFDPIAADVVPIHVDRVRADGDHPPSASRAPQIATAEFERDLHVPARSALAALTKREQGRGLLVIWVIGEYVHAAVLDDVPDTLIVCVNDASRIPEFVRSSTDPIAARVRGATTHVVLLVEQPDDKVRKEQVYEAHRTKKAVLRHVGTPIVQVVRLSTPSTSIASLRELRAIARENVERLLGDAPDSGVVTTARHDDSIN